MHTFPFLNISGYCLFTLFWHKGPYSHYLHFAAFCGILGLFSGIFWGILVALAFSALPPPTWKASTEYFHFSSPNTFLSNIHYGMISDCFIIIVITFLHIVFCLVIIHIVILTILTIIILTIKDVEARFHYQLPSARPPSATCSPVPLPRILYCGAHWGFCIVHRRDLVQDPNALRFRCPINRTSQCFAWKN